MFFLFLEDLLVVSVATNETDGYYRFIRSLKVYGYKYEVFIIRNFLLQIRRTFFCQSAEEKENPSNLLRRRFYQNFKVVFQELSHLHLQHEFLIIDDHLFNALFESRRNV